ncbi:MAG: hypothetical protein ABI467_06950 [Kofleriaceae bacterium]
MKSSIQFGRVVLVVLLLAVPASADDEIVRGSVVRVEAKEIYVSLGADRGVVAGAALRIKRPIHLKHPITHAVVTDWLPVGSASITEAGGEMSRAVVGELVMDIKVGDLAEVLVDRPDPAPPVSRVATPPVDPATAEVLGEFAAQAGQSLDVRIAAWERYLSSHQSSRFATGVRLELDELRALREQMQPPSALQGAARIAVVAHDAPRRARASEPLALAFVLDHPDRVASAYLHYRPIGAATFHAVLLAREHDLYLRGVIPAEVMRAPGIEYFVEVSAPDGRTGLALASPQAPIAVEVAAPPLLDRFAAQPGRSSVRMMVDALDFRTFDHRTGDRTDHMERATIDFTYWLGTVIQSVGVGAGVYAGTGGLRDAVWTPGMDAPQSAFHFGYADLELGGHLEHTPASIGGQLIAGVGREGFGLGAEGRFRVGDRSSTNLAFVARTIDQVGWLSEVRFGARPTAPLGVGISVGATDQPNEGDTALVLGTELELFAIQNVSITARGSWQGRSVAHAGLGGGAGLAFNW